MPSNVKKTYILYYLMMEAWLLGLTTSKTWSSFQGESPCQTLYCLSFIIPFLHGQQLLFLLSPAGKPRGHTLEDKPRHQCEWPHGFAKRCIIIFPSPFLDWFLSSFNISMDIINYHSGLAKTGHYRWLQAHNVPLLLQWKSTVSTSRSAVSEHKFCRATSHPGSPARGSRRRMCIFPSGGRWSGRSSGEAL